MQRISVLRKLDPCTETTKFVRLTFEMERSLKSYLEIREKIKISVSLCQTEDFEQNLFIYV